MSASAIGSVTSSYLTQNINNVNSASFNPGTSAVAGAGGRHHHSGGKFLQDVTQALQSLGLNMPGASNNPTATSGSSAAGAAASTATSATSSNAQQALQTFMYDLHQALSGQPQSAVTAGSGANTNSNGNAGTQNPYGDFTANIQNLLGSLNSSSASSAAGGIDIQSKLQTDFNNLVNVLGGSTASSATTSPSTASPSLQSFLQQLEANVANMSSSTSGVGALFSAKV